MEFGNCFELVFSTSSTKAHNNNLFTFGVFILNLFYCLSWLYQIYFSLTHYNLKNITKDSTLPWQLQSSQQLRVSYLQKKQRVNFLKTLTQLYKQFSIGKNSRSSDHHSAIKNLQKHSIWKSLNKFPAKIIHLLTQIFGK